jgi:hypothetical protein
MSNPIQYTSRDFDSILNDINSDPILKDTPNWWKRGLAGIGDVASMWINAEANQARLRTAFTRQAVMDQCQQIDYDLSPRTTSSGILLFYLKGTVSFPVTIAQEDLLAQTQGSISAASKRFEARSGIVVAAVNETFTASAGDDWLVVARVYTTGEKVRFTTTTTLPDPLAVSTDYYVIYVDDTHIRMALTLSDAYNGTYINITDTGTGTHTIHLYSFQMTVYQQQSISSPVVIGRSDGITEWQSFDLLHQYVLRDTLTIEINSINWTRITTFVESINTDTHFKIQYKANGNSDVLFGNGTYGAIPGVFDIYADYAYGGGNDSNVTVINKINSYAGTDVNIEGVSNPDTLTGGANEESIQSAKYLAPLLLKAQNRFVTTDDGKALVLNYGGISRCAINKNVYGVLSCQIPIVPTGGGAPSSALKSALTAYLVSRSIFESIDIRVEDPTYSTVDVTSAAKILSGYLWADVLPFYRLAIKLLFSEMTYDIVNDYLQNGIASATTLINSYFSETFTAADYVQVQNLISNIYDKEYIPDFGDEYQESEVTGFINIFVEGIDYLTWTLPAFPLTLAADEIATYGTLTLTEIT